MNLAGMKELTIGGVKLRELSVDGKKVWQAGRLPAGYTEVEYIETDGTQYIDTGVIGGNGVSAEISVSVLSPLPSSGVGIISSTDGSQRCYLEASYTSPSFRWLFGAGSNYNMESATWDFDTRYKLNVEWGTSKSTVYVDDSLHMTLSHTSFNSGFNLYLLARNNSGSPSKTGNARIYYAKIWESGTLVRDFVPAVRKSDNSAGLYDLVTGAFFGGTGSLKAGAVV